MGSNSAFTKLMIIFSETTFLFLLYYMIIKSLEGGILLSPIVLFAAAFLMVAFNILISTRKRRIITIILANLAAAALVEYASNLISGGVLFKPPSGVVANLNTVLIHLIILWIVLRSIYMVYNKKGINVYGHFDFFVILSLLTVFVTEILGITLPGVFLWIASILFFNLIPLYIHSSSDSNPMAKLVLAVAAVAVILLAGSNFTILPGVSDTAGSIFDIFKTVFLFVINTLANVLVFLLKSGRGNASAPVQESQQQSGANMDIVTQTDVSWFDYVIQFFIWIVAALFVLLALYLIYVLLRALISRLMARRGGISYDAVYNPFPAWKKLFSSICSKLKSVALEIKEKYSVIYILFLQRGTLKTGKAYGCLLRWGAKKRKPRMIYETPNDYCIRLAKAYPLLEPVIREMTDLFAAYCYSGNVKRQISAASVQTDSRLRYILRKLYFYRLEQIKNYFKNAFINIKQIIHKKV